MTVICEKKDNRSNIIRKERKKHKYKYSKSDRFPANNSNMWEGRHGVEAMPAIASRAQPTLALNCRCCNKAVVRIKTNTNTNINTNTKTSSGGNASNSFPCPTTQATLALNVAIRLRLLLLYKIQYKIQNTIDDAVQNTKRNTDNIKKFQLSRQKDTNHQTSKGPVKTGFS